MGAEAPVLDSGTAGVRHFLHQLIHQAMEGWVGLESIGRVTSSRGTFSACRTRANVWKLTLIRFEDIFGLWIG